MPERPDPIEKLKAAIDRFQQAVQAAQEAAQEATQTQG
jgi:hypothetical protein